MRLTSRTKLSRTGVEKDEYIADSPDAFWSAIMPEPSYNWKKEAAPWRWRAAYSLCEVIDPSDHTQYIVRTDTKLSVEVYDAALGSIKQM